MGPVALVEVGSLLACGRIRVEAVKPTDASLFSHLGSNKRLTETEAVSMLRLAPGRLIEQFVAKRKGAVLICFMRCWERLNPSKEKGQGAQLNQLSHAHEVVYPLWHETMHGS